MTKQVMHRNDIILRNEEDRIKIKYGIDIDKIEMEHNRQLVGELE